MSSLIVLFQERRLPRIVLVLLMALAVLPTGTAAQSSDDGGVATLTGSVEIAPDELIEFSEPFVTLMDITTLFGDGSVPAIPSQIAAGLMPDGGDEFSFSMALPIQPVGTPVNVAGRDTAEMPLVYSIDVVVNATGTPFLEEADYWGTTPTLFSSIGFGNDDIFGQLAVWSDGEGAGFPTDVGEDGEALTPDDPTEELEAGWTIVDLTERPYELSRSTETRVEFPEDLLSPNDFTDESWTDAFEALVDQLEAEYPFTEIKDIDFDELREIYLPLVEEAEAAEDRDAWTLAIYQFALEFGDGHVAATRPEAWFDENYGGGYGLTLGQTDDGTVVVTDVTSGGSAEDAGIERGDLVTTWDGEDVQDYLAGYDLPRSFSSDFERDIKRLRWITRGPVDATIEVGFTDADGDEQSAELTATDDPDGLMTTIRPQSVSNVAAMPIESEVLPSGVGYIRINTFSTDVVLFTHQWDYALRTFEQLGVTDLVIDVRANGGGFSYLSLYATASFVDEPFLLDEAFIADGDGGYEFAFDEYVIAGPQQWRGSVAVLVDVDCKSSCEMFSATMTGIDNDDIAIVGHTPSGGVYATIQQWYLPEDIYFQASETRFELDGEIFLEGVGVPLDVDVPVTADSLLSEEDEVLLAAEETVQGGGRD